MIFSLGLLFAGAPAALDDSPLFANGFELPMQPPAIDISSTVTRIRTDTLVPAMGAVLVDSQGILALGTDGVRVRGGSESVNEDEFWHLGSDTKAMTATLFATFVRDGELTFEHTLPSFFPDFPAAPEWESVTIRHLLQHRGGVIPNLDQPPGSDPVTVMANREFWARVVLSASPATPVGDFSYSNVSYVLVGAALEAHTGRPWEVLMAERLFEPLGMDRCGFGAPPSPDNAQGHSQTGIPQPGADNRPVLGPAGTVHCDLESWGQFLIANLAGPQGQTELLTASLWNELHDLNAFYAMGWGVGGWLNRRGLAHDGSNTLWYARALIIPGTDRAYGAVTNIAKPQAVTRMMGGLTEVDSEAVTLGQEVAFGGCRTGNEEQKYVFDKVGSGILNVTVPYTAFPGLLVLELYDDSGSLLTQTYDQGNQITLSAQLPAGRYFLRIFVDQFQAPCPEYQVLVTESAA